MASMFTWVDPRGVERPVASVELPADGSSALVRFDGCDHVAAKNRTMDHRVGDPEFCFECGVEARRGKG